nr:PLD nuclease N-terminal domain-containing protein [Microcella alkaliphila]
MLLGLLWLVLIVVALIQIAQSTELSMPMKLVWAVVVFFFPLLGTLVWFILGRRIGDPFRS